MQCYDRFMLLILSSHDFLSGFGSRLDIGAVGEAQLGRGGSRMSMTANRSGGRGSHRPSTDYKEFRFDANKISLGCEESPLLFNLFKLF